MPKATSTKATNAPKAAKKPAAKRKANGYQMPEKIPLGEVLTDLAKQSWKIGPSIGAGGFGEIYCASKTTDSVKKHEDYPYVVKVEPHGNGPLFVEMHFYMRNGKKSDIDAFQKKRGLKSLGMPHFVGHGSHELNAVKHRFIVMPRFGKDVWNLFLQSGRLMPLHTVYRLAIQMLDVYEYIHECTYVHGDLKGSNMLLGFGKNGGSQAYLVDFGLASHYTSKDFKPDPKKMHNGTIEYTSRDAHQGVPTMRGDFEILAYNILQWSGGKLPWEENKLLDAPAKVQQAKENLMSNLDSQLKDCFAAKRCPDPISAYFKYVTKLKYDEKPDYEKCRKEFVNGLKSLGKSNSGDLEFKSTSPQKKASLAAAASSAKEPKRAGTKAAGKPDENTENISPKVKKVRKRNTSPEPAETSESPSKRARSESRSKSSGSQKATQSSGRSVTTVVNNQVNDKNASKTYNFNFELDISFDANVVVNVKRKPKKSSKDEKKKPVESELDASSQSISEIPASEKSFIVETRKIVKKGSRTSPRAK